MEVTTAPPLRIKFPIVFLMVCVLAFIAGVLLNGCVLFITSCRLERTGSTVWFLNRAVADLIFIFFLPLKATSIFTQNLHWAQRLSSIITSLYLFSSAFLLMALSINHCILVAQPAWVRNHCTPRLAFWVVLGIWALSLGLGLRYSDLWESLLSSDRVHVRLGQRRLTAAAAIQFLVGFLIPLALILILTVYIDPSAMLRGNRLIRSTKPLKILLGLVPTFFICWLPYHVFSFLLISHTYPQNTGTIESIFASVLTYFNSCLNPIFYLTMEEEFQRYRQRAHNFQPSENSGPEPAE